MQIVWVMLLSVALMAGCREAQPPLTDMEAFVLEQASHCAFHGRPTEEAEMIGIPITDCDYYQEEADRIRAERGD